jgi:hypothetical protein
MFFYNEHRLTQIFLLLALVFIGIANVAFPVKSQTCDVPKYSNASLHVTSWKPATEVIVQIDSSFSESRRAGIEAGNALWNNPLLACSGVTFNDFELVLILPDELEDSPPPGYLVWQEDDPQNGFSGGVFMELGFAGFVESARIKIKPNLVNIAGGTFFNYLGTHEVGHTFNLNDCLSTNGCPTWTAATIMTGHADGITTPASFNSTGPKACDITKVRDIYCGAPTPTPTPTPAPDDQTECESINWFWNPFANVCQSDPPAQCNLIPEVCENGQWSFEWCGCVPYNTPLLIDVSGNGFALTNAAAGVVFNLNNMGGSERISWTRGNSDDAWLVLDRNEDGAVDSGAELFGDVTAQAEPTPGETRNGFRALAEYDKTTNGGNADGRIDSMDAVFSNLRLWQDQNHDGVSQSNELKGLPSLGIMVIELDYKESKHRDRFGNRFRFRAKVEGVNDGRPSVRWAYDVILTSQ